MSIIRPVPAGDYKETMNRRQSMTNTKHKEHKWFTTGHSLKRLVKKLDGINGSISLICVCTQRRPLPVCELTPLLLPLI